MMSTKYDPFLDPFYPISDFGHDNESRDQWLRYFPTAAKPNGVGGAPHLQVLHIPQEWCRFWRGGVVSHGTE